MTPPPFATVTRWLALHPALLGQLYKPLSPKINRWIQREWNPAGLRWKNTVATVGQLNGQSHAPKAAAQAPILLYSQVAWDDVWQRPQELARGLAALGRKVVFVSPVQLHQVAGQLRGRWQRERMETFPQNNAPSGELFIYSPLILSGEYRSSGIREVNRAILTRCLLPFMEAPVHAVSNSPFVGSLFNRLRPALTSIEFIDDFCAFSWSPKESRKEESLLMTRAAAACAGTNQLAENYRAHFPEIEYMPSGVALEQLQAPAAEPADLANLPTPRLLYVGTLNDRLDGALISRLAKANPKASVVLVGPKRETFRMGHTPSNCHFLGLKPHAQLAGYYQHSQLALMPFADNEAARAINPIKTLEYLAVGLPVLSTPVPDVQRFYSAVVRIEKPEAWPQAAQELLAENNLQQQEARKAFANGKTWAKTVASLQAFLCTTEERWLVAQRREGVTL
ncbi:MAG: glycosyltransferase [Sumerlaeia bacterium]